MAFPEEMKGLLHEMSMIVDKMKDMAQYEKAEPMPENEGEPDQVPVAQQNPKVPLIVAVLKRKRV